LSRGITQTDAENNEVVFSAQGNVCDDSPLPYRLLFVRISAAFVATAAGITEVAVANHFKHKSTFYYQPL